MRNTSFSLLREGRESRAASYVRKADVSGSAFKLQPLSNFRKVTKFLWNLVPLTMHLTILSKDCIRPKGKRVLSSVYVPICGNCGPTLVCCPSPPATMLPPPPLHSPNIPLWQGLSSNLELLFSQLGWISASLRVLPVSNRSPPHLGAHDCGISTLS